MFSEFAFGVCIALAFAATRLLPDDAPRARAATLALFSLAVLVVVLELPTPVVVLLIGAIGWIWFGLRRWGASGSDEPFRLGLLLFAPVLAAWVVGKQSAVFEDSALSWLYFVGFSFFLVKAWTLIKDRLDGRIQSVEAATAAAYFLYFPTYLSGPMHYYGEFDASLRKPVTLDPVGWLDALYRVMLGLIKLHVLAPLLTPISLAEVDQLASLGARDLVVACTAYSLVLYFDFSGYCDLAIATSRVLGVETPENFRNPYFAANVRDFWQRWHITFTRVLTAYIFLPLTRALSRQLGAGRKTIMALGYLGAFGFCGYWHGPTANFVVWGIYHALGLIANDVYRGWANQRKRARRASGAADLPKWLAMGITGVSTLATFAFVSIGWILFVLPLGAVF